MNSKTMIPIFIGVVIAIGVLVFVFLSETTTESKKLPPPDYEINFTYDDIEKFSSFLELMIFLCLIHLQSQIIL